MLEINSQNNQFCLFKTMLMLKQWRYKHHLHLTTLQEIYLFSTCEDMLNSLNSSI